MAEPTWRIFGTSMTAHLVTPEPEVPALVLDQSRSVSGKTACGRSGPTFSLKWWGSGKTKRCKRCEVGAGASTEGSREP